MAARSLRPETAHDLAHALEAKGETDEAIARVPGPGAAAAEGWCRTSFAWAWRCKDRGRSQEAKAVLDAAIAASRAEIERKPDQPRPTSPRQRPDRPGEAGRGDRRVPRGVRLKPDAARAHNNLGIALSDQGKLDEAIAEYREALRLKPDYAEAHNNLGIALSDQGKLDEAIAEYREAMRLKPDYAEAHNNLGARPEEQGKLDEAIAEYREALRLKPDDCRGPQQPGAWAQVCSAKRPHADTTKRWCTPARPSSSRRRTRSNFNTLLAEYAGLGRIAGRSERSMELERAGTPRLGLRRPWRPGRKATRTRPANGLTWRSCATKEKAS